MKEELNNLDHETNNQECNETNSSTSTPTHSLPPPYWSKNKMFLAGCHKGLQTVDVLSAHVEIILLKETVPDNRCITFLSLEEPCPLLGENKPCKSAGTKLKKLAPPCLKAVELHFKQQTIKSYRFSFYFPKERMTVKEEIFGFRPSADKWPNQKTISIWPNHRTPAFKMDWTARSRGYLNMNYPHKLT